MITFLDFEKPIAELEGKIRDLKKLSGSDDDSVDLTDEVDRLESKRDRMLKEAYAALSPWQKAQVARHPDRPHFCDIARRLFTDFTPLAGDRAYAEDTAVAGGLARFKGQAVMVIGHEKGTDTAPRIRHNFGMARPEGYRKAIRLMDLAERFSLPVISLVDTPGAYPGLGAEERGQSEAIARSTERCLSLRVPLVSAIVGEGGSGGAVAFAAGNKVLMFEHAIYSVISPEGCASILWRTAEKAKDAAAALKITAQDLLKLGVTDLVVPEPLGGAHREPDRAIDALGRALDETLGEIHDISPAKLRELRREKFLQMGRLEG